MRIGTVQNLWRCPVKSMHGESLNATHIGPLGFAGDRGYALRDERAGEIRGAKKLTGLLHFAARYLEPPTDTHLPPVEVTLPDRTTVRTDDPTVHTKISQALGHEVTLWPRQPPENLDHYRRAPGAFDALPEMLALEPGEPPPSFEGLPPEIMQYVAPLGTYFDAFPIHFLTTASLRVLSSQYPDGQFAPERFRPNLLIAAEDGSSVEEAWNGKILRLGEVELQVGIPTLRCVMTTLPQGDLPKDPRILRTIAQHHGRTFGVYATVKRPGEVRVGDPVDLIA
ncbi:MAG: MOSC domain-containing protein [Candidatus Binatia bacterium]